MKRWRNLQLHYLIREQAERPIGVTRWRLAQTRGNDPGLFVASETSGTRRFAIQCCCSPEVAKERIRRRNIDKQDASQATADVYEQQRLSVQPWPAAVGKCGIDTEQPLEAQVKNVLRELRQLDLTLRSCNHPNR